MLMHYFQLCFKLFQKMVRIYKKKKEKTYDEGILQRALDDTKGENNQSIRASAKHHNIPYTTLLRLSKKDSLPQSGGRYAPVFNLNLENLLIDYLLNMSKRFLGMTTSQVRHFAYELAIANNCTFPDVWNIKKKAGKDWLDGFLKRHGTLSLRKPEATSLARASGFNKPVVDNFYDMLRDVLIQVGVEPSRIYNVDETGLSTTQVPTKVYSAKGQKQVGKIVSQERGQNVTGVCCVSAVGHYIPPMLIFPRVRAKPELLQDAPPGTVAEYNPSGWMTEEIFLSWMQHFQRHTRCTKNDKVILLLDNHASHISLNVVHYAKEHGIEMVSFPPHCSHKLQPLDRTVYGPLKAAYRRSCDDWMAAHPGQAITIYQVAGCFAIAYMTAASIRNGVKGFECTGIWPFNSQLFSEDEFAPSLTTDIEIVDLTPTVQEPVDLVEAPVLRTIADSPCCSSNIPRVQPLLLIEPQSSGHIQPIMMSPEVLRPFPKGGRSTRGCPRKRIVSKWLTHPSEQSPLATQSRAERGPTPNLNHRVKKVKTAAEGNPRCTVCLQRYNESNVEWLRCVACTNWACEGCFGTNKCANCEI